MYPCYLIAVLLLLYWSPLCARQVANNMSAGGIDSLSGQLQKIPQKYISQVNRKSKLIEQQVNRRSQRALKRLEQQEKTMQARLARLDAGAANSIFNRSLDSLGKLRKLLKKGSAQLPVSGSNYPDAYLDTLQNSLSFLKTVNGMREQSGKLQEKVSSSLKSVQNLQAQLQQAEKIKTYIRERRQQLKEQLAQYTGFSNDLRRYNKEAYYYGQQLKEYKAILQDKKKAEAKALELLKKVPAYNDFLQKNSRLAGLFNLPATGVTQSLEGLQTRTQVDDLINQRLGSGGPDARALVSQQMATAREQMNTLKKKFPDLDNAADMPDFRRLNGMKTKSFLQRLEFGGNLQFQRSSQFYPGTSDIAGQVAYKFHSNGSIGVGTAFKLGMGSGLDNVRFSSQGAALRSFLDWKLKGTFYVNGGFEKNYISSFQNAERLGQADNWQNSALLGVSKKYKINSKLKGNIILLYDFLYNEHIPRTDPIKLRLGYTL